MQQSAIKPTHPNQVAERKAANRCSVVPVVRGCHVLAPSSVASNVPDSPTTKPWVASLKAMECKTWEAPVSRAAQLAPLSVVAYTSPCSQSRYAVEAAGAAESRR